MVSLNKTVRRYKEKYMGSEIIWEGRTSFLLYAYYYAFIAILALVLSFVASWALTFPLVLFVCLIIEAKSMRYYVSETEVYFYPSLLDRESAEIDLKDVYALMIMAPPFFKFFSLGTVVLFTDEDAMEQPCIKCIRNPEKLLKLIEYYAKKNGSKIADYA